MCYGTDFEIIYDQLLESGMLLMARLTNRLVRFYTWMAPFLLRRYSHVVYGVVPPIVARWVYRRVICYGIDSTYSKSATTANI